MLVVVRRGIQRGVGRGVRHIVTDLGEDFAKTFEIAVFKVKPISPEEGHGPRKLAVA